MISIIEILTFCAASIILMVDLTFAIELIIGILSGILKKSTEHAKGLYALDIAILVPAHNEAQTIANTIPFLLGIDDGMRRVTVIADNCTDQTAGIVASSGIHVINRHDPVRRGKGYALAFGRNFLRENPPSVVIVLDADCTLSAADIDSIAKRCIDEQRPIQSSYWFRPELSGTPIVQMSNFALMVKNHFRQRGAVAIGASAILTGSGMAFPWAIFDQLALETGNIVEDLMLTIELIESKITVGFAPFAQTLSNSSSEIGTSAQRARWEGGFLKTSYQSSRRLIYHGIRSGYWPSIWLGVHLMVPPFTLLVMLNAISIFFILAMAIALELRGLFFLAGILSVAMSVMFIGLICVWKIEGYRHLSFRAITKVPGYVVWKLAMYGSLLVQKGPMTWQRTDRNH
ncbi:glycosyltransferase family 2 protein [Novosphingobium sp.]|uniref:glycosyltransferase family 2 protein n=1 Tax=Novosphingobium sp. TaxID=1874826 RepID=UPI003B522FCC